MVRRQVKRQIRSRAIRAYSRKVYRLRVRTQAQIRVRRVVELWPVW